MNDIPKIKKKISSFLTKEEGKISKNKLMKTGLLIGLFSIISLKNVSAGCDNLYGSDYSACGHNQCCNGQSLDLHCNSLKLNYESFSINAQHNHHANHCNHGNHSVGGPCDW